MSEIVNLRLARKRRARGTAEQQAAEARARFGQRKAVREAEGQRQSLAERKLDGHRRVTPDEP